MHTTASQRGSLILEVLITLGVTVIFGLAVGALLTSNSKLTTAAELKGEAAGYAKETMEQLFAMKYEDWNNLALVPNEDFYRVTESGSVFSLIVEPDLPDGEALDSQTFHRLLMLTVGRRDAQGRLTTDGTGTEDADVRHVIVTITWQEDSRMQSAKLESFLTNWQ